MKPAPAASALRALAEDLALPLWDSAALARHTPDFTRWPLAQAQAERALLFACDPAEPGAGHIAASSDPFDAALWSRLARQAGGPLRHVLATPEDIHAVLQRHESTRRALEPSAAGPTGSATPADADPDGGPVEELSLASVQSASSPAVRLVGSTLFDALRAGASDLHLENTPTGLCIRWRIDGVLETAAQVAGTALAQQAVSRLKVLAGLDIGERRIPQDGSFRVRAEGRDIDLRLSVIPGIHGEDAVLRILDRQAMVAAHGQLGLDALGFAPDLVDSLRERVHAPHGMLLVTGPTGSGKTTTLYAALSEAHTGRDKVITIEDPVEYQLPGVLQIPVNEKKGLTFARGLRSILRHDPDKIMVGEIRDRETAEIAVQSALTGHLVLSTVHANSAFDVFSRLAHMAIDPHSLASALNGVWAQRLLRRICPRCSVPARPAPDALRRFGRVAPDLATWALRRGQGCGDCRGTGYRGRLAVAEFLDLDDELRERVLAREPVHALRGAAAARGSRSLAQAAMEAVRAGHTTLEEVRRVAVVD